MPSQTSKELIFNNHSAAHFLHCLAWWFLKQFFACFQEKLVGQLAIKTNLNDMPCKIETNISLS